MVALLSLLIPRAHAAPQAPLLGQWTFEGAAPLMDTTGLWGPLTLEGTARVDAGALVLEGDGGGPAIGWAHGATYRGPAIRAKTLVAWIVLDDPGATGGSAISLDTVDAGDTFDGIVWSELLAGRWMVGSNFYARTQALNDVKEDAFGQLLTLSVSTALTSEGGRYTLCRNGERLAEYEDGPLPTWEPGNAEVVFGRRHTSGRFRGWGGLTGRLDEARVYGGALSCAQVMALRP